jgi:hypothetical protein
MLARDARAGQVTNSYIPPADEEEEWYGKHWTPVR